MAFTGNERAKTSSREGVESRLTPAHSALEKEKRELPEKAFKLCRHIVAVRLYPYRIREVFNTLGSALTPVFTETNGGAQTISYKKPTDLMRRILNF
ncbi:hypothetical protein COU15_00160 [Candidatus Kaiserbacteria bacterium CG10_big_fil_rev_8_21_14_0_10_45_20]|uniref:Uncharacterized protein n=1 Tax=Candidatus Kaiserbacteria bacterium CG10_big_fil_rev_8_21_14_0_10_45_20 TaxID=1974607 RepID=A0A2H0UI78_9BACT|nr:MAG: hypothetical protein COU15_00160 [Candidatus Kaiserbacteria bacterium CG10_big_fil_rev_8_21_14_0_10_45_20]